jgi:broad specificity phosphatase PhoE
VGLGPLGLKQAELLRRRLAAEKIDQVYSSDLKDVGPLPRPLSPADLKLTACPELREIDFGEVEAWVDEVKEKFPVVALMWVGVTPASLSGRESLAQLEQRISRFIDRLTGHAADDNILVVAHSGVLRTLICQLTTWS